MSELPNGWEIVELVDFCDRLVDGSHNPPKAAETGKPMLSARNINDFRVLFDDYRLISESDFKQEDARTRIASGDVLLTIVGTIGRTAVVPAGAPPFALQRSVAVLKPRAVDSRYLAYALNTPEQQKWLSDNAKGTAQKGVYLKTLGAACIPVAPAAEQIRIVAKLEELLSDLDAGVAELKAAQKKLAQYRQSLLKAAVEGALTAEWRAEQRAHNKPVESGAQLLERILKERRIRWEAKQLAKFKEQGKTPPKDWQKKYPEPVKPDTSGLPQLPEGWVWASLDMLIVEGPQNGLYLPGDRYGSGTPILRIDDYQIGWHRNRAALNLVNVDEATRNTYALTVGDLVINRVNSMTHLGKSLLITDVLDGALFESNMMRSGLSAALSGEFVAYYLGSEVGRSLLIQDAKWAVNQASINQQDVRRTPVPLPPAAEQVMVVATLREQLGAAIEQGQAIDLSLKQSTAQRQNILRAAFAGQLVPQDPNDEPASVLLERIRAERAQQALIKKPRTRKPKETT